MTGKSIARASALLLATASGPAEAETLQIWIRAFIPGQHPSHASYMRPVPGEPGKTMIPSPLPLSTKCYNTNNRDFSDKPEAEAKVASLVTVSIQANQLQSATSAPPAIGRTVEYECSTGAVTCTEQAASEGVTVSSAAMEGDRIKFTVAASAANPCAPTPDAITPAIKWNGTFTISPKEGTVRFQGKVADFPSYEAYVSLHGGAGVPIFRKPPEQGAIATDLLFTHDVEGTAHYHPIEGTWQSSDPARRFRIAIAGANATFVERSGSGATLSRTVPIAPIPGASGFRVSRSNTDPAVLSFLGFAPDIQAEMLRRGPQPSYIDLFFVDGELRGSWNGILVIKNNQGKFQEMRQPGTNPPKTFAFTR